MQLEAVAAAGRPQTFVGSEQIEQSTPATLSPTIGGSTASEVLPAPPQQVQQTSAEVLAAHQQQTTNCTFFLSKIFSLKIIFIFSFNNNLLLIYSNNNHLPLPQHLQECLDV